jgi:hypothetical protein
MVYTVYSSYRNGPVAPNPRVLPKTQNGEHVNEYRSPYENDGFILHGGAFLKSLSVTYRDDTALVSTRKVSITTNHGDSLSMPVPMALTLVVDLVTALYDNGTLDMATAERVAYLCQSVLADVPKCGSCGGSGQVGSPFDPESCNTCRGTGRLPADVADAMTREQFEAALDDAIAEPPSIPAPGRPQSVIYTRPEA